MTETTIPAPTPAAGAAPPVTSSASGPDADAALAQADAALAELGTDTEGAIPGAPGDYRLASVPSLSDGSPEVADIIGAAESIASGLGLPAEPVRAVAAALAAEGSFSDWEHFVGRAVQLAAQHGVGREVVADFMGDFMARLGAQAELRTLHSDSDFKRALFGPPGPQRREAEARWKRLHEEAFGG